MPRCPSAPIIQWDKNDLESLGLLKVDVLALGMLTAMRTHVRSAAQAPAAGPPPWSEIRTRDTETYDMICRADTIGVFQIESRAQMSMLPRLRPQKLLRPGDRNRDRASRTDQGRHGASLSAAARHAAGDEVPYPSEELRPVLEKTRGVPIFQEQVMQIAIVAAGFTPGEADQLRRAMGAWQRSGKMGDVQAEAHGGHARERLLGRRSPNRSTNRSKASANTAFRNRIRRRSRC